MDIMRVVVGVSASPESMNLGPGDRELPELDISGSPETMNLRPGGRELPALD
eukprot:CAMPEP_0115063930 /NCGR_PEP_ID=MMETSP0227-20121206/9387_1 /TAXON_ID=89957 /ORGANISM="Polarella glacialis, Strain CCMP 1383" /LENGTH=51 /DNA_ID=CAMNT_0002449499 /DNA_START=258 /DNA_END=413 /DNA_ORIENTATION=-